MVFAAMMLSVPTLPASAEVVNHQVTMAAKTVSDRPALVALRSGVLDASRADFTVTKYDIIRLPVPLGTRQGAGFGAGRNHHGVDWNPGVNTPVRALADGVVSEVGNPSGTLGVYVVIDHIIEGRLVSSAYGHMALGSLDLEVGDAVRVGDVVGLVGSTGMSTGPHLHFEIRENGTTVVDPIPWLAKYLPL